MLVRSLALAIAFGALATGVSAQTFTLPSRTVGITPLKGQVTSVRTVPTPVGNALKAETQVTLKFTLLGCLDQLMPLISHTDVRNRRATVYITALNAHTEESMSARCFAPPQASALVNLPGVFQRNQIQVVFLEQPGGHESQKPQARLNGAN